MGIFAGKEDLVNIDLHLSSVSIYVLNKSPFLLLQSRVYQYIDNDSLQTIPKSMYIKSL